MQVLWYAALGVLLCGWFAVDGFIVGTGIVLPWLGDGRRWARTAVGPFLLGGEMWLVASAGLAAGAFPSLERILRGEYPVVAVLLAAWMVRDAALWLGRRRGAGRGWDLAWTVASAVFAFCVGELLGILAHGLPAHREEPVSVMLSPASLLCGFTTVAVLACYGCAFSRLRLPAAASQRATMLVPRLAAGATVTAVAAIVAAVADPGVRSALSPGALVAAAVPLACAFLRERAGRERALIGVAMGAFAAVALPLALGLGLSGPLRAAAVADSPLAVVAMAVLPVVAAYQSWLVWVFRRPVSRQSAVFF